MRRGGAAACSFEQLGCVGLKGAFDLEKIEIVGGTPLQGRISISGAKNAALPLMVASLLTSESLILENVPRLKDVQQMAQVLGNHGVDCTIDGKRAGEENGAGQTLRLRAEAIVDTCAPYALVSKMRASFWVIGPLLARMGQAEVSLPGGCAIGTRPVDFILDGLRQMGAEIALEQGYVHAQAPRGLQGARIVLPSVSVGTTHTLLMAACLAKGETCIENAACEPEISDLALCLSQMGAKIEGIGTAKLCIQGVPSLTGAQHRIIPDRIEAGTYAIATCMAGGCVAFEGISPSLLACVLESLTQAGAMISYQDDGFTLTHDGQDIRPVDITTAPYPAFPTDLQAQFMALMTRSRGTARILERIFENRFMHVQELARLGAKISLRGQEATVTGVPMLKGAPVMATDLRASVSLVIAGLAAQGTTRISRIYHLDRGFERLEDKLSACGAHIIRSGFGSS